MLRCGLSCSSSLQSARFTPLPPSKIKNMLSLRFQCLNNRSESGFYNQKTHTKMTKTPRRFCAIRQADCCAMAKYCGVFCFLTIFCKKIVQVREKIGNVECKTQAGKSVVFRKGKVNSFCPFSTRLQGYKYAVISFAEVWTC